jgi:NTE family protein
MADAEPQPQRRYSRVMPLPDCVALVLQGGGALGSYQAGVIEALAEQDVAIDWVAGISIGAINAAIVAGNPPALRVERLRAFWDKVTSALPSLPFDTPNDHVREFLHEWAAGAVLVQGVPGFFRPRVVPPMLAPPGSCDALSFYDSAPLADTLNELVDWDLLNHGPVRLSVGVVEVESGNFHYFDTATCRIDARHIMASGALPPGLPPVDIDGKWYWDGGLVSNTPLVHVLDHQDRPMLVFQVDLFSATSERPRTMSDVINRRKEITYSSRTRQISSDRLKLRQEREAIAKLLSKLPPEYCDSDEARRLRELSNELPLSLVHLIHRPNHWEGGSRDFEFSARTMREHWAAGRASVAETMARSKVIAENIVDGRTAAFDLTTRRNAS